MIPASGGGGPWQVSPLHAQCGFPRWRQDGEEIFYLCGNTLFATGVACKQSVCVIQESTRVMDVALGGPGRWSYDVSPDGQRFLFITSRQVSAPRNLSVLLDWAAALN